MQLYLLISNDETSKLIIEKIIVSVVILMKIKRIICCCKTFVLEYIIAIFLRLSIIPFKCFQGKRKEIVQNTIRQQRKQCVVIHTDRHETISSLVKYVTTQDT